MDRFWDSDQPNLMALIFERDPIEVDRVLAKPARKPRKPRKLSLAGALRQAAKAGAPVARVEITGDRVTLVMGEATGEERQRNELDDWIAKRAH
jgi:hypothetical protein